MGQLILATKSSFIGFSSQLQRSEGQMARGWQLNPQQAYAEAIRRIQEARARRARALSLVDLQLLDRLPEEIRSLMLLESLSLGSYLMGTKITDVALLARLKRLRRVHLGRTPIADITPLSALKDLRVLYLAETKVTDLSPLLSLSKLERLNLFGTRVTDLGPISVLPNLKRLDIRRSAIVDLRPLARSVTLVRGAEFNRRDGLLFSKEKIDDPAIRALADLSNPRRTREVIRLLRRREGLRSFGRFLMPPDDHDTPLMRATWLRNLGFNDEALEVIEDAVAERPYDPDLRARRNEMLRQLADWQEEREVAVADNLENDDAPPPLDAIPRPEGHAIQFTAGNTGPIDLAPASEAGEHLHDGVGQRQDYTELRRKAAELNGLGANRLGRASDPIARFLKLPEQLEQVRLKLFWSRMNTLRIIFQDHEKATGVTQVVAEPDERALESTVASHLKDLVETLNIFVIGDPGLMELDSARPGPQDPDVVKEELVEIEPVINDLTGHPDVASEDACEALTEQFDNVGNSPNELSGRQATEFARRSIRNFVGELLRRAYGPVRELSRATMTEAATAWKNIRESGYRTVGAALVGAIGTDIAGVTNFSGTFVRFVSQHAEALIAYVTKAFQNPALVRIIEWIAQLGS